MSGGFLQLNRSYLFSHGITIFFLACFSFSKPNADRSKKRPSHSNDALAQSPGRRLLLFFVLIVVDEIDFSVLYNYVYKVCQYDSSHFFVTSS